MEMRTRTPEEIKEDVSSQLFWDNRIDHSDIAVDVTEDGIILSGTVPSYGDRLDAEDDAYLIPGVRYVDNRLRVSPEVPPGLSDDDIGERIRRVLEWSPIIDDSRIRVEVHGGIVTLSGTADSYWQGEKARGLAANVVGVVDVVNDLVVRPQGDVADEDILNDILNTLARNTLIDTERVEVSVKDGVVTLSGTVEDYNSYRTVAQVANYTFGVIDIRNKLAIT